MLSHKIPQGRNKHERHVLSRSDPLFVLQKSGQYGRENRLEAMIN